MGERPYSAPLPYFQNQVYGRISSETTGIQVRSAAFYSLYHLPGFL